MGGRKIIIKRKTTVEKQESEVHTSGFFPSFSCFYLLTLQSVHRYTFQSDTILQPEDMCYFFLFFLFFFFASMVLLLLNSFGFCISENVFNLLLSSKAIFPGYGILGCQGFFSRSRSVMSDS